MKKRLTKKQFIIGISAVCLLALVIEGILLIHTFSGKHKKGKKGAQTGEEAGKAENYEVTQYSYIGGKRTAVCKERHEADSKGRLKRYYRWVCAAYFRSSASVDNWDEQDVVYSFDSQGRLSEENCERTSFYGGTKEAWKERVTYEYPDPLTKVRTEYDKSGVAVKIEETQYDERGAMVRYTEKSSYGTVMRQEERGYDQFGNLVTKKDEFFDEEDVYEESQRKVLRYRLGKLDYADYYDEQGRVIRRENYIESDGEPQILTWWELEYGEGRICSKCTAYENGKKKHVRTFDGEGKVVRVETDSTVEVFDWSYEDPALPGKQVLKRTTSYSKNNEQISEHLYLVSREDNKSETPGDLRDYDYAVEYAFSNRVRTETSVFTLDEYDKKVYNNGTIEQMTESVMDAAGYRKSTTTYDRRRDEATGEFKKIVFLYREFDKRGNCTKSVIRNTDGEISEQVEYEYVYYD